MIYCGTNSGRLSRIFPRAQAIRNVTGRLGFSQCRMVTIEGLGRQTEVLLTDTWLTLPKFSKEQISKFLK